MWKSTRGRTCRFSKPIFLTLTDSLWGSRSSILMRYMCTCMNVVYSYPKVSLPSRRWSCTSWLVPLFIHSTYVTESYLLFLTIRFDYELVVIFTVHRSTLTHLPHPWRDKWQRVSHPCKIYSSRVLRYAIIAASLYSFTRILLIRAPLSALKCITSYTYLAIIWLTRSI